MSSEPEAVRSGPEPETFPVRGKWEQPTVARAIVAEVIDHPTGVVLLKIVNPNTAHRFLFYFSSSEELADFGKWVTEMAERR